MKGRQHMKGRRAPLGESHPVTHRLRGGGEGGRQEGGMFCKRLAYEMHQLHWVSHHLLPTGGSWMDLKIEISDSGSNGNGGISLSGGG